MTAEANNTIVFPKRAPGRKNAAREAAERAADLRLCEWIEERWRATGLAFGTRGWAYICENEGFISKGQFAAFEDWLARVRKEGLLDPDAVADDDARRADHGEYVDDDDPEDYAAGAFDRANDLLSVYTPISIWQGLDTYVEVLVEKVDLKVLFRPVCRRYRVPLTNGKGSNDINSRRRMLQRYRAHAECGRNLVLLYAGDHDPAGLDIARVIKSNLMECANIRDVGFDPTPIEVARVGLTVEQIDALDLPWIDNLETGSGKNLADPRHPDHRKPYVQDYIATHGPRKVEANALARNPAAAQDLIESAINGYIPPNWPTFHFERLVPHQEAAREAFAALIARTVGGGAS
ncbi:hypothetical protein GFL95_12725 [Rhizobium leguminosarum bv. viciae]|uniref:hypothetical protein n=1 Tax=Rhizobium leguminosarum TaxID=384 RepID=UPI00144265C2|nr:hypothetical protein [Rhizobium leguminosarum]NKK92085.1 hypothetical protein [Rhizobium leguminosarum bv. viciae]